MCRAVTLFFFFQAEDGIRYLTVTGVQTCALPIFQRFPYLGGLLPWRQCLPLLDELRKPEIVAGKLLQLLAQRSLHQYNPLDFLADQLWLRHQRGRRIRMCPPSVGDRLHIGIDAKRSQAVSNLPPLGVAVGKSFVRHRCDPCRTKPYWETLPHARRRRGGACALGALLVGRFLDRVFRLSLNGKRCRKRRRRGRACALAALLVGRFRNRAFRLSLIGKRCRKYRRRGGACVLTAFPVGRFHGRAFRIGKTAAPSASGVLQKALHASINLVRSPNKSERA